MDKISARQANHDRDILSFSPLTGVERTMSPMVVDDVAKKSAKPKEQEAPEQADKPRKPMILQVRGSEDFRVWFERLSRHDGLTPTALFDRAVRRYAKEVGFTEEPPQR